MFLANHLFKSLSYCVIGMLALVVSACSVVPGSGPIKNNIQGQSADYAGNTQDVIGRIDYALVDVDANAVKILTEAHKNAKFNGSFTDRRSAPDIRIGLGDTVRVAIFEAGSGGLFVPTGGTLNSGNFVTVPDQEVDRTGSIKVPYAARDGDGGVIRVYQRRPIQVQKEIEERLADRAIEPQVVVTVVNRASNLFSVIGDVNTPGRFDIPQSGIRVLDALGRAGGSKYQDYETLVTLQRSGKTATARVSTLISRAENNIFVRPGDLLSVKRDQQTFDALGASGQNGNITFDSADMNVATALAKAGGLLDDRADPHTVLIYRIENHDTLYDIGIDTKKFSGQKIPTIYRLNVREAQGYFLAKKMPMEGGDVLYISNAPIVEILKLGTIINSLAGTNSSGKAVFDAYR